MTDSIVLKQSIITSGSFSAKGNLFYNDPSFNGVHVSAKKLIALGITDSATLQAKAPIYAIIATTSINRRDPLFPDATGNEHLILDEAGVPMKYDRQEATCVFLKKEDMLNAINASTLLNLEAKDQVSNAKLQRTIAMNATITASGMTAETVVSLLESSLFD